MKIVGYMPKRKDFETEYDEDAETWVCEMEFSEEDPEDEYWLKLQVLEHYNSRIDERNRWKRFVIEWNLLDLKKI